jgi:ribosomal protein S18 acetylase RimI-like enzyme
MSLDRSHLEAVICLCEIHGWESYTKDAERTWRAFNAPGVVSLVAMEDANLLGFISMLTDGVICSYISLIAVVKEYRGRGVGKRLVEEAFNRSGSTRYGLDLLSTEGAKGFYQSFAYRSWPGYRIYPPFSGL